MYATTPFFSFLFLHIWKQQLGSMSVSDSEAELQTYTNRSEVSEYSVTLNTSQTVLSAVECYHFKIFSACPTAMMQRRKRSSEPPAFSQHWLTPFPLMQAVVRPSSKPENCRRVGWGGGGGVERRVHRGRQRRVRLGGDEERQDTHAGTWRKNNKEDGNDTTKSIRA